MMTNNTHHSSILHFLGKVAWLITSLAAVHIGLNYFNINLLSNPNVVRFVPYINIAIGIAGVISLILLVMCCMATHKCDCGKGANCKCSC